MKKGASNVIRFPNNKQTPEEVIQTLTDNLSDIDKIVVVRFDKEGAFSLHYSDMPYAELCMSSRLFDNLIAGLLETEYDV